jgi:hypothetical protein
MDSDSDDNDDRVQKHKMSFVTVDVKNWIKWYKQNNAGQIIHGPENVYEMS